MKSKNYTRSSIASAALGAIAVIAAICFTVIRSHSEAILFPDIPLETDQIGGGNELVMEPLDLLSVTDDRIQLWILVAGSVCALLAMMIAIRKAVSGAKDHFSAIGLTFGAIGLSWIGVLAFGLI